MKKLNLLLVALALVCFTAFYSCAPKQEKAAEEATEQVEEVTEEVVEAVADTAAVVEEAAAE
ncbi:MAG: hypothetical protein A2041_12530 [Bacteroidetes bacterium GWA2_31_9b]|nr:MAG: hypothetical protein A2041_12530 [Bacteroidetes bacterium GWA2_31_9b]